MVFTQIHKGTSIRILIRGDSEPPDRALHWPSFNWPAKQLKLHHLCKYLCIFMYFWSIIPRLWAILSLWSNWIDFITLLLLLYDIILQPWTKPFGHFKERSRGPSVFILLTPIHLATVDSIMSLIPKKRWIKTHFTATFVKIKLIQWKPGLADVGSYQHTTFSFAFRFCFRTVPRSDGNVFKTISVHARLRETPENM